MRLKLKIHTILVSCITFGATSAPSGAYDIINQPPANTNFFYPTGIGAQRLPNAGGGGPTAHLMPNSDAVIQTLLGYDSHGVPFPPSGASGGFLTGAFFSPGANDGGQIPMYFGQSTDPVYKVVNIKKCGAEFAPLAITNSNGYITNLTFHAPTGAVYSSQDGGDDNTLVVWDVSGSGISNGHAIGFYGCCGNGISLPNCPGVGTDGVFHAGTQSDPCAMNATGGGPYCSWGDPLKGSGFGEGSAADGSNDSGPFSLMPRFGEVTSGHIFHAMNFNTNCEATAGGTEPNVVFPAGGYEPSSGALKCTTQTVLAPPNGSLYFLDYTDAQLDCLNPAKPACNGADGKPITKINPIHYIFVEQMSHYGGYESDTGGPASTPGSLSFYHVEASEPYLYYSTHGFTNPDPYLGTCPTCFGTFANLMNTNCTGPYTDPLQWCYKQNRTFPPNSAQGWQTRIFYNLPTTLPGPTCSTTAAAAGNCGVGKHLHIADPCVAVSLAGLSQSPNGKWPACYPPSIGGPPAKPNGLKFN